MTSSSGSPTTSGSTNSYRLRHAGLTRVAHWLNFGVLIIMLWTGLRIYNANDVHAIEVLGLRFRFFPQGFFDFLDAHRRLARGIGFHLTFGWIFVLNGLVFLAFLARKGRYRKIVPTFAELRRLPSVLRHELGLGGEAPVKGEYNPAQKAAYTAVLIMGILIVLTGFAIYKPVQLKLLTTLLGGYEFARLIHFTMSLGLVGFFFVHVFQVIRSGWKNFAGMVTGYEPVEGSPK